MKSWGLLTVESSLLAQKPYFVLRITSHRAYDNSFFFSPLETIHGAELNARICFFKHSC